ncbi:MAG TPA: LysR substrate-binding domain-containing protein [Geminicoccaceae bacterium]|nr:LysR substrate-binding domain-containing protein [Geminicoccaceae bacterium]
MDLRAIEYFAAVAECGTVRGAAARLGITQPALTKAIRRLEDEVGAVLFDRQARGVTLTAYGRTLLRHARNLQASLKEARDEMAALRAGIAGRIRIGAGPSWEQSVLPQAITRFREARPGVQIYVLGGVDAALKAQLRAGDLDFVLAATPDAPQLEPDLDWRPLIADDYRVIAAAHHPLHARRNTALADLLDYPWILPGAATQMAQRLRIMFRAHGLPPPEPVIETDIVSLKLALMRDSDFLGFHAAAHLRAIDPGQFRPIDVPGGTWRRAAGIITLRRNEPSAAAAALIDIIEAICADAGAPRQASLSAV